MKTYWPAFGLGSLLLASAAGAVLPANVAAQETPAISPAASATISRIEVARSAELTTVRISGTGDLHFQTSRLDSPPRLVLDFSDVRLSLDRNKVSSEYSPVLDVRAGQPYPGGSRVVVDLEKPVRFSTRTEGGDVIVSLPASEAAPTPAAIGTARRPVHQRLARPVVAPAMPLPNWLTNKDFAFARPADAPVAPVSQGQPSAAPQSASAAPQRKYTGEPISVNLKDVDLKDFFRLIHEISGLNVVLDPAVRGSVTLVLDEVPWDQALDIVLRNNGLTKEIDGNVLRIATQDTLKREADAQAALLKSETDAIEPVTVTRTLSYANAPALMPTLKRFLTARGDVLADIRTNSLIIRDIPSSIPKVDDLLRQLDRKSQQVEIDARVVQTTRSFAREIGTEFGFSTPVGNTAIGGLTGNGSVLSPVVHTHAFNFTPGSTNQIPLNTNLGATSPSSGLTIATQGHNYAIDFILSLMESRGIGKILSEPKGITQTNQKLTVKQGTQVPIQTTINNTISVQYVDATLKMEVTPQVTSEGTVFLDISVENTQIDKAISVQGNPGLDTQSTQTKVLINDGGTVVIGGVVVNNQNTTIDQVPLLGSMPLIGNLFKHTSVTVSTQELMFFVTPRILPS